MKFVAILWLVLTVNWAYAQTDDAKEYVSALVNKDISPEQACKDYPEILKNNPEEDQLIYLLSILSEISFYYDRSCAEQYEGELLQRVNQSGKPMPFRYYAQYKAHAYMGQAQYDSALAIVDSALALGHGEKYGLEASLNTIRGSIFYYQRQYKKSAEAFANSVKAAELAEDTMQYITALVNTGSAYNGLGYSHTALGYFEKAYEFSSQFESYQSLLIRNNLSALLIGLNYYDQAAKILEEMISDPELTAYPNHEARYLAYANAGSVCAQDPNLLSHCDSIVQLVTYAFEHTEHYKVVISSVLFELYYANYGVDRATEYFSSIKTELMSDTNTFVSDYDNVLYHVYKRNIDKLPFTDEEWMGLESAFFNADNARALERYYNLTARLLDYRGSFEQSSQYWYLTDSLAEVNQVEADSTRIQDFAAKYDLEVLSLEKEAAELELKNEKRISRLYQYGLFGALFSGVLIVLLLWSNMRKSAKKREILEERAQVIQKEKTVLEREKLQMQREMELDNRIISFSSFVMENGMRWYQRLKEITEKVKDTEVKKELLDIRHNLHLFLRANENTESNELLNVALKNQEGLIKDPEVATELNSTEKRVLALSAKGLSTKEIAELLGFSLAYINNIRSSIRKKLSIPPKTSIEDFVSTENLDR
jgi:DNA-binding CsgD family transcriptional regulator